MILIVRDLIKTYPGVRAVDGVSFEIAEGICFGLLGPNGAGKTTTVEMIEGVTTPTAGEILFRGRPRDRDFRERIGIQFQKTALPDFLTVREVLALFAALYRRSLPIDQVVRLCSLEELVARQATKISGGQLQRLLVALALVNDPEVLFLDEPTTGLDPQARRLLWQTLRGLHRGGLTLILTTHYMEEADRLCERLAIVDHGRILTVDTPAALKRTLPGGQILDVWVKGIAPLGPRLESLPGVSRVERVERAEDEEGLERLRLFVDPGDGLLDRVLQLVRAGGGDLRHVSLTAPSLEDVYIHLTGKELRE